MKKIFGTSSPSSNHHIFEPPSFEDFKIFLPKYLSDEAQENLFSELKYFPKNLDDRFYTTFLKNEQILFQGDGYDEILMPDYGRETFKPIKAFLISNSCDASTGNRRIYSRYLSFAPIIDLAKYKRVLVKNNNSLDSIESHMEAIRKQHVSSFFYLPSTNPLKKECFVRLDCVFSIPASLLNEGSLFKQRIFTLSDFGFYLLVFKLSVHFSRVQEAISRNRP